MSIEQSWVPSACTLPTADRPVRLAEFDDLFAFALRKQWRLAPTRLRWRLDPASEGMVRDLTGRETSCCSFFTFTISHVSGAVEVEVRVPDGHVEVLDALATRAATRMAA